MNKKQILNMHTLRDFPRDMHTPDELREEIFCRLSESEVSKDLQFDFGYYKQNKKLWINSAQDVREAWSLLDDDGGRLTFWCTSVQKMENSQLTKKRVASSEADGAASTKKKRISADSKAEQVEEMKSQLKQTHGAKFNELQYRLWAEVLVSGVYTDTQNPPPYPVFGKARKTKSALNQCTSESPGPPSNLTLSPGTRAIELRGKCIDQIKEIVKLHEIGALSDTEFERERLYYANKMQELK